MFTSRFRVNDNSSISREDEVLRELPVSSIDSDANIGRRMASIGRGVTIIHLSPDRPPRIPIHTRSGDIEPFCSPVQYVYATGRTRRRLELSPGDLERPVTPTFDDFQPRLTSTPGPSTPNRSPVKGGGYLGYRPSPTRSSPRKRGATQCSSGYHSGLGSPLKASILEESVSWLRRAKRARRERAETSGELTKRLQALTSEQLATVVSDLVKQHTDLEEDLQTVLPEPDISQYEEKVSELLHNIYRAMPRQRLSSSRSAFCYRRVRLHIIAFKRECVQYGQHFIKCRAWDAAIRYVLVAWQLVHKLPVWECPAHNRLRTSCYQGLSAVCVDALRSGGFSLTCLDAYRPRIEAMVHTAPEMGACLQRLNVMSETTAEA